MVDRNLWQTGDPKMSVQYSKDYGCWTYSCIWGCFGFDFESEQEATDAFLSHECI